MEYVLPELLKPEAGLEGVILGLLPEYWLTAKAIASIATIPTAEMTL